MRRLSEESRQLVDSLVTKPGLAGFVFGRPSWNLETIEQLGRSREPAAIPHLVPVLVAGDDRSRMVAAQAIRVLLSEIAPDDLSGLDEVMRHRWWGDPWHKLQPRELAKWVGPGEPGTLLLQLSSMHSNGFVREEAVRRLRLLRDGSEVPYLLLRLNDWMRPVRDVACQAVVERIEPDYADRFVQNLGLVVRLQNVRRNDLSEVLRQITWVLTSAQGRQALIRALGSDSRAVRRASFQMLMDGEAQEVPQVLEAAVGVTDPVIRLWAARAVTGILEGDELRAVLLSLSRDPSGPVRQEALKVWATRFRGEAGERLVSALLDRNASVRNEARFRLRDDEKLDIRQFYRNALGSKDIGLLIAALAGLAETSGVEEAETLVPFLSDPVARVRRAAICYLARLAGDAYFDHFLRCAMDASPGVSKQAFQVLRRYAFYFTGARLWDLFSESKLIHFRRNVLRLIAALPKWESIPYLLRIAHEGEETFADLAREYVIQWDAQFNRSQTVPSQEQLGRVEEALTMAEEDLPGATVASMRFSISAFRTA